MTSGKVSQTASRSLADWNFDFEIDDIVDNYDLHAYRDQNQKRKNDILKSFCAVDIFRSLELVNRELALMRTEIVVLNNFLSRVDHKFIRTDGPSGSYQFKRSFLQGLSAPNMRKSKPISLKMSKSSASQISGGRSADYHLNYLAKGEMTTQSKMNLDKEIIQLKKSARNESIDVRSKIKESECLIDDIEHMEEAFRLHFLNTPEERTTIRKSTEENLAVKLHSFETTWMKLAQQLVYKIRLETQGTIIASHDIQNDITAKVLFRNILCQADYDLMKIKRDEMENEVVQTQLRALSNEEIMSKVAAQLTSEKKQINECEKTLIDLNVKMAELKTSNANMMKDTIRQEKNYERDLKKKEDLLKKIVEFSAPSVNDYVTLKETYQRLMKEEKTLRRKLYITGLGKK